MNRRRFLAAAGSAVLAGTTSGCALSARGDGRTPIQVLSDRGEITAEVVSEFERLNPEYRVNLIAYSWDIVLAMLAAGNPPDVVRGAGATDTPFLARRELALPLDDLIANSAVIRAGDLDVINDLWRVGEVQGVGPRYGLVKDYSCDLTLWVNRALLPEAELPSTTEPVDYRQLLQLGRQSHRESGGRTSVYGFGSLFDRKPDLVWLQALIAQTGDSLFNSDLRSANLSSPGARAAMQFFVDVVMSKITPSFLTPAQMADSDLFAAERMALFQAGYWVTGLIDAASDNLKEAATLLPAPQLGGVRISPVSAGTGYWIPRKSRQVEGAWRFLEFYLGGELAVKRAQSGWGVPALKSMQKHIPTHTELHRQAWQTQQNEQKYFQVLPFTPYGQTIALSTALTDAFETAVRAGVGLDDLCARCEAALNAALARGK